MNIIRGYCRTNLDDAKRWTWPTEFAAVPRVGDRVQAKEDGPCTRLKVVGVTHLMLSDQSSNPYGSPQKRIPGIEVELNK